jgi:hypothetical protein
MCWLECIKIAPYNSVQSMRKYCYGLADVAKFGALLAKSVLPVLGTGLSAIKAFNKITNDQYYTELSGVNENDIASYIENKIPYLNVKFDGGDNKAQRMATLWLATVSRELNILDYNLKAQSISYETLKNLYFEALADDTGVEMLAFLKQACAYMQVTAHPKTDYLRLALVELFTKILNSDLGILSTLFDTHAHNTAVFSDKNIHTFNRAIVNPIGNPVLPIEKGASAELNDLLKCNQCELPNQLQICADALAKLPSNQTIEFWRIRIQIALYLHHTLNESLKDDLIPCSNATFDSGIFR